MKIPMSVSNEGTAKEVTTTPQKLFFFITII